MNVKLSVCRGCLLLAVLPLVGLILLYFALNALFGGGCDLSYYRSVASPSVQHIAQIVIADCNVGATTSGLVARVLLRSASEVSEGPDFDGETIFSLEGEPVVTGLSVTWEGEDSLLIEYRCETECVGRKHWQWRDVRISYHCLDP